MTSARDLTSRLADLLRHERSAMADFLVALADFDRQKLWLELGHASVFSFLRRELGLSAGAAQYRKSAAELIQSFPEVEAALRSGKLCLSSIIELAKVITPENRHELLPRFFGLSRREAEAVAVSVRPVDKVPRRDVVAVIRAAPSTTMAEASRAPSPESPRSEPAEFAFRPAETMAAAAIRVDPLARSAGTGAGAASSVDPQVPHGEAAAPTIPAMTVARQQVRDCAEPLDSGRSRFHVTVSRTFVAKLDAAKAALSHAKPNASTGDVLEAALDLLLAQHAKRKGLVAKPRNTARPAKPGVVPAAVRREVWQRAEGRCEFPVESGGVCGSTLRLEFDHVVPKACGGPATIDNVRLTCRVHNQLAARRCFGDQWMDRFTRNRRRATTAGSASPGAPPAQGTGVASSGGTPPP